MLYAQSQLILFFFLYCFVGWVWECCYVAFCQKRWENRGFLHGPCLPIYGSGAIIILWLTLPVRGYLLLIFLLGMIGASLLEYMTGAVMERVFQVRYWDYSHHKWNLNGHICLLASLAWGAFSILLVRFIHPPAERFVLDIPISIAEPLSLALTIIFVIDATRSVQAALDLKEILAKLRESSEELAAVEKEIASLRAKIAQAPERMQEKLSSLATELKKEVPHRSEESMKGRLRFPIELQKRIDFKSDFLLKLRAQLEQTSALIREQAESIWDAAEREKLLHQLQEIDGFMNRIKRLELTIAAQKGKAYERAANLLRRNTGAVAPKFKESLTELKQMLQNRSNRA